jgi:hypothetical protein
MRAFGDPTLIFRFILPTHLGLLRVKSGIHFP